MSSTGSPTLILDVRSRRTESGVVIVVLLAASCAPFLISSINVAAASGLSLFMAPLLAAGFRRAGWLGGMRRIETSSWISEGRWILMDRAGTRIEATLTAGARAGSRLVWLQWRTGDRAVARRRFMLLTRLDVPAEELRRLIVRLRIDGSKSIEPQTAVIA